MFNKAFKILKQKNGVSMIFVLAVTLLLLIIGTSALVAASANAGAGSNQASYNRVSIYCDSLQNTIMASMQHKINEVDNKYKNSLAYQIQLALYNYQDTGTTIPTSTVLTVDLSDILPAGTTTKIDILYGSNLIEIVPEIPEDVENGIPRTPKLGKVSATISIKAEIKLENDKRIVSVATYKITDSIFSDDELITPGEWRLVKHEKSLL